MATTILTVPLPPEIDQRLGRLAERTRRTKAVIAGEAIAGYVERELALIDDINEGLEDVRAGRVVPHDQVMEEVRALITDADKRSA